MESTKEFRKAFRVGTRWVRTNHINPRAATPVEVEVMRTGPQEAIVKVGGYESVLRWPDKAGFDAYQIGGGGWQISSDKGPILTYMPLPSATAADVVEYLLRT